jgi:uncharacterized protein (DUF1499 family)
MALGITAAIVLLLVTMIGMLLVLAAQSRVKSVTLGVADSRLRACPATPNCVSSDASAGDSHYVAPIADSTGAKWVRLIATVSAMKGANLVDSYDRYAHFTFTSSFVRFVDDVEFHYRPDVGEIAVRFASRVGRSDWNANRNRVESIRGLL